MKQKGFASTILLLGTIVLVGVGYLGYNYWLSNDIRHTPFIIPTPTPIPVYNVDDPSIPDLPTSDSLNQEYDNTRQRDLYEIQAAIEQYVIDTGKYPTSFLVLSPTYIKAIPKDPVTQKDYELKLDGEKYLLSALLSDGSVYTVTNPDFNYEGINADQIRKNDLKYIQVALELYRSDASDSAYPTNLSQLTTKQILRLPKDPETGNGYEYIRTSSKTYTLSTTFTNGARFTLKNP